MKTPKVILFMLLGTFVVLISACSPAPQSVADSWQEALNKGDIDMALSHLTEEADVTIIPAGPDGDGIYNGQAEIRGWYETIVAGKGAGTLNDCKVEGEIITCVSTYADEGLKSLGVDFIEGDWVATIRDGKIRSYTFTITPESLAKFPPSPEPTQSVADSWITALNKGDINAALSYLAEEADVTITPTGPDGDGVYNGQAEIRGWYETIVAAKGIGNLSDCKIEGESITCLDTYTDEGLKSMGVDFIEGDWVATIRDGKIQSYTFTIRPESLAKFPPPPEPEPVFTATPAPEVRITTPEALVGNWVGRNEEYEVLHEFREDGSLSVKVTGIGLISNSRYWFEDGLLKIEDLTGDCVDIIGSYELYATYAGEQPIQLRFVLVGKDSCSDRKGTLAGKTMLPPKP